MRNQKKFSLNKLQLDTDLNKKELKEKKSDVIIVKPTADFVSRATLVYETDWATCELEKIPQAVSTTIEELLPEKAKYEYIFELDIPEKYLQYLNFNVLAKTIPEQNVTGVQEFNFTSLQEVAIDVYKWLGRTQIIGSYQTANLPTTPPPASLYNRIQYPTTPGWYFVNITFIPNNHDYFGCPEDEVPPGGVDPSTTEFPLNYWDGLGRKTFQDFYSHFGNYDDAVENLNKYYDTIFFTPEADGPPYHSYIAVTNNDVCVGDKQVIINKLATDKFQIKITGNFLLLSKAVTETTWSDPSFPTYEPQGDDMQTRLRVYLDPTLNTITYENYTF